MWRTIAGRTNDRSARLPRAPRMGLVQVSRDAKASRPKSRITAAEKRLMDEFVIVPILYVREAALMQGFSGLGADAARNNPGFVGSLRSVTR